MSERGANKTVGLYSHGARRDGSESTYRAAEPDIGYGLMIV